MNLSGKVVDDFLSPVNSQLEVRDTDVVLSTVKLNLCLKRGEEERWMKKQEGWSGGSNPRNRSKAMEKAKGLEEVNVYRSLHTNSGFNKRIKGGITYTYPPCVQQHLQQSAFHVCWSKAKCALETEKWVAVTTWRNMTQQEESFKKKNVSHWMTVENIHFHKIICSSLLHNRHFKPQFIWSCEIFLSLAMPQFFPTFLSLCQPFLSLVAL